jgi:hypothetical protein
MPTEIFATSINNVKRKVVYHASLLLIHKSDELVFQIDEKELKYTLIFAFQEDGEDYSTTFTEVKEKNSLRYVLHKWNVRGTWIEIASPVKINVKDSNDQFWMKFRSTSSEEKEYRRFELTVWKYL